MKNNSYERAIKLPYNQYSASSFKSDYKRKNVPKMLKITISS